MNMSCLRIHLGCWVNLWIVMKIGWLSDPLPRITIEPVLNAAQYIRVIFNIRGRDQFGSPNPLVMCYIAIENGHRNSEFTQL